MRTWKCLIIKGYKGYNLEYNIKLDLKRLARVCSFAIETEYKRLLKKVGLKSVNEKKQAYVKKHFMD